LRGGKKDRRSNSIVQPSGSFFEWIHINPQVGEGGIQKVIQRWVLGWGRCVEREDDKKMRLERRKEDLRRDFLLLFLAGEVGGCFFNSDPIFSGFYESAASLLTNILRLLHVGPT
jgi:hypothetical protein